MRLPATFDALRERDFAIFYVGLGLSLIGTWMERQALLWLVYDITGDSEQWLGLAAGAPLVPALLLSIPAGAMVDRVDVRKVLLTTQSLMLLGAAGIATVVLSGVVRPWHIVAYAVYASAVFTVDAPARHAFVVRIVGRDRVTNAFALNAVAFQVAQVVGSGVFGVIMLTTDIGEGGCLAINAVSFACVLASLFFISPKPRVANALERPHPLEGLRYAARQPVIRAALILAVGTALLGFQVGQLFPVYAKAVWAAGPDAYAWLRGALGAGALFGGIHIATRASTLRRGRLVFVCGIAAPPLLVIFAHAPSLEMGIALAALMGFVMIQSHSATSAMIQTSVPDDLRGRVSSLFTLCVLTSFPLGGLVGGFVAEQIGAPWTTTAGALTLVALVAAVHLTHPEFRRAR